MLLWYIAAAFNAIACVQELPVSDSDYYLAIGKEGTSTCETLSDRTSWIDVDSGSILSGEMLNYITYGHKARSMTADNFSDNFSVHLGSDTTSLTRFPLRKRSSSSFMYFSENKMFHTRESNSK